MEKLTSEKLIEIFISQNWENREKAVKNLIMKKRILRKYYKAAKENKLAKWRNTLRGKLALILIYDQIPRIIFNDKRMYETDELAKEITKELYESKEYKKLSEIEQMFAFCLFIILKT